MTTRLDIRLWGTDNEGTIDIDSETMGWSASLYGQTGEFLALPKANIPKLVTGYLAYLRESPTTEVCKCEWAVHPDDVNLDTEADVCKFCQGKAADHPRSFTTQYNHPSSGQLIEKVMGCAEFKKPRKRIHKLDDHHECPMHTETGRILGFYEWLFPQPELMDIAEETVSYSDPYADDQP